MRIMGKLAIIGLALCLALAPNFADARAGKGSSSGSRGQRSYSAPPPTQSAPAAKPLERSATPAPSSQPQAQPAPAAPAPQPMPAPMSPGRSFFSGLAGGLIGAGIAGMLFGHGFGGGMGFGGFLGGLLQLALLGGLAYLAFNFFRRRQAQEPASAMAGAGMGNAGWQERLEQIKHQREAEPAAPLGMGQAQSGQALPLMLGAADYDAFEDALIRVQSAWSRRDHDGLKSLVTSEMYGYFTEQLKELADTKQENHIDSVKLEKGDLSEAWREGSCDYATVSMRFTALDYTFSLESGKIVEGSDRDRIDVTEYWTFKREGGEGWKLSAIQQV
jgi:predicted lipid-binding transport protein (Tim44 family)